MNNPVDDINSGIQVPESDETLELLLASVPPSPAAEEDQDDPGAVIHASTISGLEEVVVRDGTAVVEALRRPRDGMRAKVGFGLAAVALLAFGAVAWAVQRDPAPVGPAADRTAIALHEALSERDQELLALQAAHQEEIQALRAQLGSLREQGDEADSSSVAALETRLEETLAQAAEVEAAAREEDAAGGGAVASRHGQAGGRAHAAVGDQTGSGYQAVEANPYADYDGVSSATTLNERVWGAAASTASGAPAERVAAERAAATEPGPATKPANEIEELLESAIARPTRSAAEAPSKAGPITDALPDDAVPSKPSRQEVRRVMDQVAGLVRRCGGEAYSKVTVQLAVAGNTGRVTEARAVDREHAGTTIGSCAARAVRSAKFPRFAQEQVVIKYPFDF